MRNSSRHSETTETPDERRDGRTVSSALAALGARLRAVGGRITGERRSTDEWQRVWLTRSKARWRRGNEVVECFRFDDAFVATVEYVDREVTWQLTAGPASLPCALAAVALYVEHGTTPQIDPDGRPFVAVGADGPRQVFEESASEPVEYVYLDAFRTLEEVPDSVEVSRFRTVGERLDPRSRRELRSDRTDPPVCTRPPERSPPVRRGGRPPSPLRPVAIASMLSLRARSQAAYPSEA